MMKFVEVFEDNQQKLVEIVDKQMEVEAEEQKERA
jgi:hypothetical protein